MISTTYFNWLHYIKTTDDLITRAGKLDVIEVTLRIMKTHINNADICEKGCAIFLLIATNG